MSSRSDELASLKERQGELTRQLILDAAVQQAQDGLLREVTMRSVAQRANIAERTVFRYFASREQLLDELAVEVSRRLELPALPATAPELARSAGKFYAAFEAHASLTTTALHSELFDRIRDSVARDRWARIRALVDAWAPRRSERVRAFAAAHIRYLLAASTWHYYRFYFGFSLEDSIAAAQLAIEQTLAGLKPPPGRVRRPRAPSRAAATSR
ncbi:helix-turn-helix domain-containing protein [Ramlibacter sp.]|uniref:TetR/AcrR family transcriptional regulator n=1 Tax=Ramlibacter sp. TaxID=1917967 RepID=UPI002D56D7E0|nr:helix-turn-helix domain-containing protein [Ramlibacter sp.]HYD76324.1 helix-turn-helix domain-containing protein [Ramlibacter sp.]